MYSITKDNNNQNCNLCICMKDKLTKGLISLSHLLAAKMRGSASTLQSETKTMNNVMLKIGSGATNKRDGNRKHIHSVSCEVSCLWSTDL